MTTLPRALAPQLACAVIAASSLALGVAATAHSVPRPENRLGERRGDVTAPSEAALVDAVKPALTWTPCGADPSWNDCATVELPLNYSAPQQGTITMQVQRRKTGSEETTKPDLFVLGRSLQASSPMVEFPEEFFSTRLLEKYNIVGIRPRGTLTVPASGVRCFTDPQAQRRALLTLGVTHPVSASETDAALDVAAGIANGCSTVGMPMAAHLSLANQMRDLEVVRRLMGNPTLTAFALEEGTQAAHTYASMFPDRLRAIYVDGAVDPVAYAGGAGQSPLRTVRTNTHLAAAKTMNRFFAWCDAKTVTGCTFADAKEGGSAKKFAQWYQQLTATPVPTTDPLQPFTAGALVSQTLDLIGSEGPAATAARLSDWWDLTHVVPSTRASARAAAQLTASLSQRTPTPQAAARAGAHYLDTLVIGSCHDGQQPATLAEMTTLARDVNSQAPMFGLNGVWTHAPCAADVWKAGDPAPYQSAFTAKPASPLLLAASTYSPRHDLSSATAAAQRTGATLITNEGWGNSPYRASRCVAELADTYLLEGKLPSTPQVSCAPNWSDGLPK